MTRISGALLTIAAGVATFAVARADPAEALAATRADAVLEVAAGWAVAGVGLARRSPWLVASGIAWLMAEWSTPGVGAALPFTLGLVAVAAAAPLLAHAALGWSWAVGAAYVGAALLGPVSALFFDPVGQHCLECPRNLLLVQAGPFDAIGDWGTWVSVVSLAWLALLVVLRTARWWLPAAAFLALVAVELAAAPFDQGLWRAQAVALLMLAAALAWQQARSRRARRAVAQLVIDAGRPPEQLPDEIAAAARLLLDNEAFSAQVRAQLDELRASRARIVAAGDAERRRLERDLHDGAQQRLVAVGLALRMLPPSPQVDSAQAALQETIAELRAVAHGIFPAVLADEGLAAAIEALADDEPLRVGPLPRERLPPPVESAAYFVVAEAVRRAGAAQVSAARRDGLLVVDVTADHVPEPLADLEDRVGAANGTLAVDGRTLRVELPCA